MAVRFSFLQGFNSSLNGILRAQKQTFETQQQVSSGRRIVTPADDPVASARIIQINQELSQLNQYITNADAVENRLALAENQIQQVSNLLVRVRELAIQGGGLALTQSDRQGIAAELDTRLEELVDLANTRDVNGEYIFAGFQGSVKPFERTDAGEFIYNGDDGQRKVQIASSTTIPISDSGKSIFVDIESAQKLIVPTVEARNTGNAFISTSSIDVTIDPADDLNNYERNAYPDDFIVIYDDDAAGLPPAPFYTIYTRADQLDNGTLDTPLATILDTGSPMVIDANAIDGAPASPDITNLGWSITINGSPATGDRFYVGSTEKQSVLTTVGKLSEGMKNLTDSVADELILDRLFSDTLINLDHAEARMSEIKAQIGARQNTLDSVRTLHEGVEQVNQEVLSEIRDLDYAEALSRLTLETFTLEAAQQSFAKISTLSLFNFLR
ncbi:flagellar hook-associated protein FlgL [Oceanicoccus sp. KOV_DT_Chl]|uniref:flagellar hook-associated protein FlgL n=1 Tax=Oceanicoccus sp. KOV_DT_Chl TaxID=1904639 RepID=UPI000C7B9669|nr:flagellar hook-associated protein FlgL [Oceanicoccus sp. KOV_DT_Chl]